MTIPKLKILVVLSSANQLYSGIGRCVFALASRSAPHADYEFAIDGLYQQNVTLLQEFCDEHSFPLHVGRAVASDSYLDPINLNLRSLLQESRWDAVESIGWANAASHGEVLREAGCTLLAYTPHYQPSWTVPMGRAQSAVIEEAHQRMLETANIVFCDTPWERSFLQASAPGRGNCRFLPLGCDLEVFRNSSSPRLPQILFVGDLREPRKRFDRILAAFRLIHDQRPEARLLVIGNATAEARDNIPPDLRRACTLKGYVPEAELVAAYQDSALLLSLSEYEAFGLPVLEALACGTPVVLATSPTTRSVFARLSDVQHCPGNDVHAAARLALRYMNSPSTGSGSPSGLSAFRSQFGWQTLAERKFQITAAAWTMQHWGYSRNSPREHC